MLFSVDFTTFWKICRGVPFTFIQRLFGEFFGTCLRKDFPGVILCLYHTSDLVAMLHTRFLRSWRKTYIKLHTSLEYRLKARICLSGIAYSEVLLTFFLHRGSISKPFFIRVAKYRRFEDNQPTPWQKMTFRKRLIIIIIIASFPRRQRSEVRTTTLAECEDVHVY